MPSPVATGRPLRAALARFAVWMAFAFCLFQSITVTERWWSGELSDPGPWEWLWIALLPALVGVYLRYFSILGCGRGCAGGTEAPTEGWQSTAETQRRRVSS